MTQYCDVESNRIEFKIRNDEGCNTFSKAAVTGLFVELSKYIGSRIVRRWQHDPLNPPKLMTITIKVEIE